MDQLLRTLAYYVFDRLNAYIAVHDDLQGFPLFRRINYAGNAELLVQIHSALQSAQVEVKRLSGLPTCQHRHRVYLAAMTDYLTCLLDAVSRLHKVALQLDKKSRGLLYQYADFDAEMTAYRASVNRYQQSGYRLKAAWDEAGL